MLGDPSITRSLLRIAGGLQSQIAAYGLFTHNADKSNVGERAIASRLGFANSLFQLLEEAANLRFEEGETPICYNRASWPSGAPIAGYAGDSARVLPSQLLVSYVSNWSLDADALTGRLLRAALFVCAETGFVPALSYLSDLALRGFVGHSKSFTSAIYTLLLARQGAESDDAMVNAAFGGSAPSSHDDWMNAELNPAPGDDSLDARMVLPYFGSLVEVAIEAIEAARDVISYDEWLIRQHHLSILLTCVQSIASALEGNLPPSTRSILDQLEEIKADAGGFLTAFRAGFHGHPLRSQWGTFFGALAVFKSKLPDDWESRFVEERAIIPLSASREIIKVILERQGDLPPQWSRLSGALAPSFLHAVDYSLLWLHTPTSLKSSGGLSSQTAEAEVERLQETLRSSHNLSNKGRRAEARSILESLREEFPWSGFTHWECGILRDVMGETESALECIVTAILLEPENEHVWHSLAVLLDKLHCEEEARIAWAVKMMIEQKQS